MRSLSNQSLPRATHQAFLGVMRSASSFPASQSMQLETKPKQFLATAATFPLLSLFPSPSLHTLFPCLPIPLSFYLNLSIYLSVSVSSIIYHHVLSMSIQISLSVFLSISVSTVIYHHAFHPCLSTSIETYLNPCVYLSLMYPPKSISLSIHPAIYLPHTSI